MNAALYADGEHGNDVGVVELRCSTRLVPKPRDLAFVEHRREGERLERDPASERHLLGLVHHAHTTSADLAAKREITDRAHRFRGRNRGGLLRPDEGFELLEKLRSFLGMLEEDLLRKNLLASVEAIDVVSENSTESVVRFRLSGWGRRFVRHGRRTSGVSVYGAGMAQPPQRSVRCRG